MRGLHARRCALPGLALAVLVGCSKAAPAAVEDVLIEAEEVLPEPIDLRSLELDEAPAEGADAGMWVRCSSGMMRGAERPSAVCTERSQTWVDGARDRVALVATAAHAQELIVEGKRARFVDGRARVELDLRALMARVRPSAIGSETELRVAVQVLGAEGVRPLVGELTLVTPRVSMLLAAIEGAPLSFPGERREAPANAAILVLAPDGAGVRVASDDVELAAIDVVAVDHGVASSLPACEAQGAPRTNRAIELVIVDRRSGEALGERRWPAPAIACGHAGAAAPQGPTDAEIIAGLREVLAARAGSEPRAHVGTTRDPLLAQMLGGEPGVLPPLNVELLRRLETFLGVGPDTGRDGLVRAFGEASAVTPSGGGLETFAFGPHLGALVDASSGRVIEVWVVGAEARDALSTRHSSEPLLAHIGQPLAAIVAVLGAPSKVGEGFVSWAVDAGPLTIYAEMQCARADGWVCNELDVGWLTAKE